jgi:DNA polymerase I-like protein with 3'-5' exonuclease and polymerase domains
MDNLALRHLGKKTIAYEEVCGKGANQIGFAEVDIERATAYAAEDADITLRCIRPCIRKCRTIKVCNTCTAILKYRFLWCCKKLSATAC